MALPVAPPPVRWITRTLEEAGYETWAVGGAVRDALRDHPSGDWDLATRARPGTVRSLFRRTVPIGVEHGTVGILARDGTLYEITTFRKDVETDGRHAVVEFADTIADDLARRDFTINAIAWHALREELFDPFDGADDLRRGVLRTVGLAADRFREDYLRILRALRFAGRFGLEIEATTWEAARALVDRLTKLSPERIREELLKILGGDPRPARSLTLYAESGALRVLYPELDELRRRDPGRWSTVLDVVQRVPASRHELRLAALLRPLTPEQAAAVLLRLRLSNATVDEVARLTSAEPLPDPSSGDAEMRRWLSRNGVERLNPIARLDLAAARVADEVAGVGDAAPAVTARDVVESWRRARAIRRLAPPLDVSDLALDGRDLIALGLKPGPRFGEILEDLLAWVIEDPTRNERALLEKRVRELGAGDRITVVGGNRGR